MQMSNDDWFALPEKIEMISDKELADGMRALFALTEGSIQRGWSNSNDQRSLRDCIDFILAKNNNTNKRTQQCK